jgi:hypothetical protein
VVSQDLRIKDLLSVEVDNNFGHQLSVSFVE